MKVELIGTGAIYTKYNSASTLINEELLIDIPNGCHKQLLKMEHEIEKIKTLAITHFHGDHFADLLFLIRHRYALKLSEPLVVIAPKGAEELIKLLFDLYNSNDFDWKSTIKIIEIENSEQEIKTTDGYTIKAIEVKHGDLKSAYGYIINDTLGLTGDSGICEGVRKIWTNSKIMIADTSFRIGEDSHMGIDNIKELLENCNKKIIATHLRDVTRETLKNEKISNLIIPEDGYSFEI